VSPSGAAGASGRLNVGRLILREDAARLGTYVRVVKPEEFVEALSESFDNGA